MTARIRYFLSFRDLVDINNRLRNLTVLYGLETQVALDGLSAPF